MAQKETQTEVEPRDIVEVESRDVVKLRNETERYHDVGPRGAAQAGTTRTLRVRKPPRTIDVEHRT